MLEANDVAILLRSDERAHIDDALERLRSSGLFRVTSLRRGFAGGSLEGGKSLPAADGASPRACPAPS